ncbi:MAG: hypothetical protein QW579_00085 [Desulfurococcaceae archaeon]
MGTARNEEEVRVRVSERCIEEKILKPLSITQYGHYEYTLISGARVDALYGHVIVEYKAPGKLSRASDIAKKTDTPIIGVLKRSYSRDISDLHGLIDLNINDRLLMTMILEPGQFYVQGTYGEIYENTELFSEIKTSPFKRIQKT